MYGRLLSENKINKMSTRGVPFHILPNHAAHANRPVVPEALATSGRYQYNSSPVAVNKFSTQAAGKNIATTTLIASRAGAAPTDSNPYMMSL